MKPKNRQKRLKTRQDAWETMKADSPGSGLNKKKIHKPSGGVLEYTKPGSLKK